MLWAFPRQFQGWVEKVQKEPLASAGYGAVVLINGYLMPVLALFLLVGLLLGLLYLSLSSLAWMSFWAGLGLLMTFFTLFLAATVPGCHHLSQQGNRRLSGRRVHSFTIGFRSCAIPYLAVIARFVNLRAVGFHSLCGICHRVGGDPARAGCHLVGVEAVTSTGRGGR